MTDAELVIRTRAGDPDAFGILVSRYYDACWRFAYHMTGERADAEDVLQDAFLRAYLAIGRYDERDQFRGWLFRILTNQCRNALTARGRSTRRLGRPFARRTIPTGDDNFFSRREFERIGNVIRDGDIALPNTIFLGNHAERLTGLYRMLHATT